MTVTAYIDGLAQPTNPGLGIYAYVIYEEGRKLAEGSGLAGRGVTSNFAEYTALAEALKRLRELKKEADVVVRSDSKLLVGQMGGGWKVKGGMYVGKMKDARDLMRGFGTVRFEWVPREENAEADLLTRVEYEKYR